ncbi:hypothetical protein QVD17_20301 [Tagetes erecta]|uniref:Uncharacterized protein n=1 Tax=Tagetes erecta TaxID=13708 RepID=A0AAD8KLH8_TARER|nr:hypothetical protein QVD17_20301 [Tagetes erecta]
MLLNFNHLYRELSRCPDALKFWEIMWHMHNDHNVSPLTIVSPHAPLISLHHRNCRHGYDKIYDCKAESRTQDK